MRPSRHQMFMAMARAAATRSTCYRLNVGAVLVYRRSVVSVGYNGAPSRQPHCDGNGCRYYTPQGCRVVHAEENAIGRLGPMEWGQGTLSMYVTHSPCAGCAERAVSCGLVSEVYFETPYRDPAPVQRMVSEGLLVWQLLPSGMLVDQRTGDLVARP